MIRLPRGFLNKFKEITGIDTVQLSRYISGTRRPGAKRAAKLERAAKRLGYKVPLKWWLLGKPGKVKSILLRGRKV